MQADWQGPNAAQKHGGSPEGLTPPHSRTIGTGDYKGNTYEGLAICRDLEENFAKAVARRLRPMPTMGRRRACTACSVCAVSLGPRDNQLANLPAQRKSGLNIERRVDERIECRIAGVVGHVSKGLGVTGKQV